MDVKGQRILIVGDSLSHVGADAAPNVVELPRGTKAAGAAPGFYLGAMLLDHGAEAVRINAKVGRSAASLLSNEGGAQLIAQDATWRPSKVIVMLGTNDTQRDLAKTEAAMLTIANAYRESGAEVWGVGPFVYVGRGAVLNAPADRVATLMQQIFGPTFIDARPLSITDARAGDGIHFTAASAPLQAQTIAQALLAKKTTSPKMIVHLGIGFGIALVLGLVSWGIASSHTKRRVIAATTHES